MRSALVLILMLSSAAQTGAAEEVEYPGGAGVVQKAPETPPPERRRIVEGPIQGPAFLRLVHGLKYPFHRLGDLLEKGARKVEKDHLIERLQDYRQALLDKGYQPLLGGLGTGSGLSLGVNVFRPRLLGSGVRLDVPIQFSTNRYAGLGAQLTFPILSEDRLFLKAGFDYQHRPQEDFFGLGAFSSEADRSNFALEKSSAALVLGSRLRKSLVVGFPVAFSNTNIARGTDQGFPKLQDRFVVSQIPGAADGAQFLSAGAFLEWDYRNQAAYPTSGGIWRLESSYFRDTESQDFRFLRYRIETAHYLPLGNDRVLALRALGLVNDEKGNSQVPFFMKAILGGKETLRGFREFRFYDDNALLFSAEYRWPIWKFADAALFVDEGQVAREPGDFSLSDFRNSYGVGLRFKSERAGIFRFDVGRSTEGWRFYVSFSLAF